MKDSKTFSEKGEEKTTSPVKTRDFVKAQSQEKLTRNPQRDILKGEAGQGETSKQKGTIRQQIIQEILTQRRGRTSSQAEIQLGSNRERYPMRGGTKAQADAYLEQIDAGSGQEPGSAREEMNKFNAAQSRYHALQRQGMYNDNQGRTPYQRAANENVVGYDIYKEHRRLLSLKEQD